MIRHDKGSNVTLLSYKTATFLNLQVNIFILFTKKLYIVEAITIKF